MASNNTKKHVVFLSLPMSGLKDDEIREHIEEMKESYLRRTGMDIREVAFIDTMKNPNPPLDMPEWKYGIWYIGHSLIKLSQCDEVFFHRDWYKARGCRVEHKVCHEYDIPFDYMVKPLEERFSEDYTDER